MSNLLRDRFTLIVIAVAVVLTIVAFIIPHGAMEAPHPSFVAETLFVVGPLHFTNSMLMSLLVAVLLVVVLSRVGSGMKMVPGRLQNLVEIIIEFLRGLVESTAGKNTGRRIFPLIATLFIFIISANWLALLPIQWFG